MAAAVISRNECTTPAMSGVVAAVCRSAGHTFRKPAEPAITLLAGLGVEGDAHMGVTVKHRHDAMRDPTQPNLRQLHLVREELHDELRAAGFSVAAGMMGENVTTRGLDLVGLPCGTRLRLGSDAVIEVTGLRSPCYQLDKDQAGLLAAVRHRHVDGAMILKDAIMAIVVSGGEIRPGDKIAVELPPEPHRPLECV